MLNIDSCRTLYLYGMTQNLPLVSIALCVYNGERYLKTQLDSLLSQTYQNIEIIVTDDCSTDASFSILESYVSKGNIKVYRNVENLGFVKNFEKCLQLCTGQFIALCDQDDIWLANKISMLIQHIGNNLLIYADSLFIDTEGNSLNKKISYQRNFYKGDDHRPFIYTNCVSGHAILIKKELVPYIFPFPENVFHDWWIAYIASTVGSITFVPQVLVMYRQHSKSQTDFLELKPKIKDELANKSAFKLNQLTQFVAWLSLLENNPYNSVSEKKFIHTLKKKYSNKFDNYFSYSLLFFLLAHHHILFYCKKKSILSKFNFAFQQSIGFKAKLSFDKTYRI
jgi:glycosyltransferase involved in cell wall biosynthesis